MQGDMNRYEAIFCLGLATALVLDACGSAQATATENPVGDGGGQAGENTDIGADANSTADNFEKANPKIEALLGEPLHMDIVVDPETMREEFNKGTFFLQSLNEDGTVNNERIENPDTGGKYFLYSGFEVKNDAGDQKGQLGLVSTEGGAQMLVYKLPGDQNQWVSIIDGLPDGAMMAIPGKENLYNALWYLANLQGVNTLVAVIVVEMVAGRYTGDAIWGADFTQYSDLTLPGEFYGKNAMVTEQFLALNAQIRSIMEEKGIKSWNYTNVPGFGISPIDLRTGQVYILQNGELIPMDSSPVSGSEVVVTLDGKVLINGVQQGGLPESQQTSTETVQFDAETWAGMDAIARQAEFDKLPATITFEGREYAKDGFSTVKDNLVKFYDKDGNLLAYNYLTGEYETPRVAGIIELDLTDGTKWEMPAFYPTEQTEEAQIATLEKLVDFIINDNVDWGNKGDLQIKDETQVDRDFYLRLRKIVGIRPVGALMVPFDNQVNIKDKFSLAYKVIEDQPEMILVEYSTKNKDGYGMVYVNMSVDIFKSLFKNKKINIPSNPQP